MKREVYPVLIFPSKHSILQPQGPTQFPGLTWTYLEKVLSTGPLALWTQGDASGTVATEIVNGWNGTYSNCTLGQAGIGDGGTSAQFHKASNSYCDIYSLAFASAFNGSEGSLMCFGLPDNWTNGLTDVFVQIGVNASTNRMVIYKPTTNNTLNFIRSGGGTNSIISVGSQTFTSLTNVLMTWSESNNAMMAFIGGAQAGTTQTGLGTYTGALGSTVCTIGAVNTTPLNVLEGRVYGVGIWGRPLTSTEAALLAVVP